MDPLDALESSLSWAEFWATLACGIVAVGLFIEYKSDFAQAVRERHIGLLPLGAMLVTLGVAAEFAFQVRTSVLVSSIRGIQRDRDSEQRTKIARVNESAANAMARASEADARAAEANQKAEEERLARVKLEARIAPRSMTQAQQNELTAQLSGLGKQTGTVMASPSTPESEWLARVLTAPLKAAGWDMTILPGTATATVLQPTGVVIQYSIDFSAPLQDQPEQSKAASRLADGLNGLGISATAIPGMIQAPMTMQIVISTK